MPNLNDPDPIEYNGKILYENELDRVKKVYGFLPPNAHIDNLEPEERARRQLMRAKRKINKAR